MNSVQIIHMITEPCRFRLLILLFKHHYCVKALSKSLGISESAVSQHLHVLKNAGLIHGSKIGYQMHYQVDKEKIEFVFNDLLFQLGQYPNENRITKDLDCSCEFIDECIKRDSKVLEE